MAVQNVQPEEITRLWEQVLSSVQNRLGSRQAFDTWFKPIVPREMTPETVELEVPNTFFVDWIYEHHLSTLRESLADVLGAPPEVRFSPIEAAATKPAALKTATVPVSPMRPASPPLRIAGEGQLISRLTFETFVVGSANRFTHAA